MGKHTWYLIGLVLVAAACSPVLEPKPESYAPHNVQVGQPGQDTTTYGWRGEGQNRRRLL